MSASKGPDSLFVIKVIARASKVPGSQNCIHVEVECSYEEIILDRTRYTLTSEAERFISARELSYCLETVMGGIIHLIQ